MTGLAKLFTDIATVLKNQVGNYTFTMSRIGTGLNDVSFSGEYTGSGVNDSVVIAIDSVGATDTFSFTYNGHTQTLIPIVAGQLFDLVDGIGVTFAAKTGHALNNSWTLAIKGELVFQTVRKWNDQYRLLREGKYVAFAFSSCLIELKLGEIEDGGNGMQLYNDMRLILHIAHEFYDNKQGDFEQDIEIFDLSQVAYSAIQKQMFDGCSIMTRVSEEDDEKHDNTVTFKQEYKFNFEDNSLQEVRKYIIKYPDTNLQLQITK